MGGTRLGVARGSELGPAEFGWVARGSGRWGQAEFGGWHAARELGPAEFGWLARNSGAGGRGPAEFGWHTGLLSVQRWVCQSVLNLFSTVTRKFPYKSAVYKICRWQISLTRIDTIYAIYFLRMGGRGRGPQALRPLALGLPRFKEGALQ